MLKQVLSIVLLPLVFSLFSLGLVAQDNKEIVDTTLLAKKKGLLGVLANSLSVTPRGPDPIKIVNPFLRHAGKTIRNIEILRLGFERSIFDTTVIKHNFGIIVANGLHKSTSIRVIQNNLFFKKDSKIEPYVLADNERYLRDQAYIQDARILIDTISGCTDSVDVIVITKDVFPIGGALIISSPTRQRLLIKNENFLGSGTQLYFGTLYDKVRNPQFGYGAGFLKRNIMGSFIDWGVGYETYNNAFNSGRREATYLFTHLEKPFVTLFKAWIGAVDLAYNKTSNNYLNDSLYNSDYKYSYRLGDLWVGYNFSSKQLIYKNMETGISKLIAVRGFYQRFTDLPDINRHLYDYQYANITGVLAAFNIFKQDVYRANFIYSFGKNEDMFEGFSAALIGGWTIKEERSRPYFGTQAIRSHFSPNGFYTTYVFRMGGSIYKGGWEDVSILFNIDHFTRLKKMGNKWYNRNFFSAGFSQQIKPTLDQPLHINSIFGLPYFRGMLGYFGTRSTVKAETVFFNMQKILGFRMAPFLFADMSMLTPIDLPFSKGRIYSAIGGGVRTGNDNLSIGTIEFRGYYFPRTVPGMKNYRIEIGSNIRFKYTGTFILKPNFVIPN